MAGTSRRQLSSLYSDELAGVIASQWGEDVMVTCDDKIHMSEQTTVQTVQGPVNFSKAGSMHTFASPLNVTGAGVNTFGGPFNATSTGVNTFAGAVNMTSTGINTWAGPFNVTNTNVNTFAGPINATHQTSMNTFDGPMDFNGTANIEGILTLQSSLVTPNSNNLSSLTTGEVSQLMNMGAVTVSSTQWGYLGGMDQSVKQSDSVTFNNVVISTGLTTPNSNNLASLVTAEVTQLLNIGAATISGTQWGYVGGMNQGVAQGSNVTFGETVVGNLLASTDTNHKLSLYAAADKVHLHPGDEVGDCYFVFESQNAGIGMPKMRPNVAGAGDTGSGYLGDNTYWWEAIYSHYFRYKIAPSSFDAYDDLALLDACGKDAKDKMTGLDFIRDVDGFFTAGDLEGFALGSIKQLHQKVKDLEGVVALQGEEIDTIKGG